LVDPQGFEP